MGMVGTNFNIYNIYTQKILTYIYNIRNYIIHMHSRISWYYIILYICIYIFIYLFIHLFIHLFVYIVYTYIHSIYIYIYICVLHMCRNTWKFPQRRCSFTFCTQRLSTFYPFSSKPTGYTGSKWQSYITQIYFMLFHTTVILLSYYWKLPSFVRYWSCTSDFAMRMLGRWKTISRPWGHGERLPPGVRDANGWQSNVMIL